MRKSGGLAAVLLALAPIGAHAAAPADFEACDGYGAPGLKYNGMQKGAWRWSVSKPWGNVDAARTAVISCDAALADPLLVDAYWLRRAVLIQAKAIHQIDAKLFTEALATLDQADAVGTTRQDDEFEGSIRIANRVLRALAYYGLDNKTEAHAALASISAERPWSVTLSDISFAPRLAHENDYATYKAGMIERAVIDPNRLNALFWISLSRGEFSDAIAYSRQISFDIPRSRRGWTMSSDYNAPLKKMRERAEVAGATAYALATTGDLKESAETYKRGLDDIAEATVPPGPDERGRPPTKSQMREYDLRKAAGMEATVALEDWGRAIALRREAPKLTLAELKTWAGRPKR